MEDDVGLDLKVIVSRALSQVYSFCWIWLTFKRTTRLRWHLLLCLDLYASISLSGFDLIAVARAR
jgi:hypothetical protein